MIIERVLTTKTQAGRRLSVAEQAARLRRLRGAFARRRPQRTHQRSDTLPSGVAEDRLEGRRRLRRSGERDGLRRGIGLGDTRCVRNARHRRLDRQRATQRRRGDIGPDIGTSGFEAAGQTRLMQR